MYYFTSGPINNLTSLDNDIVSLANTITALVHPLVAVPFNNGKVITIIERTATVSEAENLPRYELIGGIYVWMEPANTQRTT